MSTCLLPVGCQGERQQGILLIAATEASKWSQDQEISLKCFSQIKKEIRANCIHTWQRRWERQEDGRHTFNILPRVSTSRSGPKLSRKTEITINRLTSGHSLLAEHAHRMKLPWHPSPICSCGNARETVDHFLLHCSNYSLQRDILIAAIGRIFQSAWHNLPTQNIWHAHPARW